MTHPETQSRPATVRCVFCSKLNRVNLARLADGPKCAECGRPIRLDRPLRVTDGDFDTLVGGSSAPVVVDFFADWCGPCRMMAPTLDQFAHERAGEVLVLKLDTDANPATAQRFEIKGIPTVIGFRDGKETRRHVGLADLQVLQGLVG